MTLREMTAEEKRQKADHAMMVLDELDPYFTALERAEYEALLTVKGSWWRADRKRREHVDRINTIRGLKDILQRIIQQGRVTERRTREVA